MTDTKQVVIACVHDGIFHSDEILALALLRIAAHPFHVAVIRSRSPKDWERADYVIDVGGKFDGIKWFDHHQPQGAGIRENGIPYSAFGLIWKHLGITAIRQLLKKSIDSALFTEAGVQEVADELESFVSCIDAHDQAMLSTVSRFVKNKSVTVEALTLQQLISNFNPVPLLEDFDETASNKLFYTILDWAETFLTRFITRKASRILAESFVAKYDAGDSVLVLPQYCDWNAPVSTREHIKFVVCPSVNGKSYQVMCTKKGGGQGSTDNLRMPFPQAWAGLNEGDLRKISGISDAVFCHRDRFIAAAMTLQGAIAMAKLVITEHERASQQQ